MSKDEFNMAMKLKGQTILVGDIVWINNLGNNKGRLYDNKARVMSFEEKGINVLPVVYYKESDRNEKLIPYDEALNFINIYSSHNYG